MEESFDPSSWRPKPKQHSETFSLKRGGKKVKRAGCNDAGF